VAALWIVSAYISFSLSSMVGAQHINTVCEAASFNGGFWPYLGWQTLTMLAMLTIVGWAWLLPVTSAGPVERPALEVTKANSRLRGPDSLAHHRIPLGLHSDNPNSSNGVLVGTVVVFAV